MADVTAPDIWFATDRANSPTSMGSGAAGGCMSGVAVTIGTVRPSAGATPRQFHP